MSFFKNHPHSFPDDDYEDLDDEQNYTIKECKFCGKGDLTWEQFNGKWRLIDARGIVHKCKSKPIDVDKLMNTKL